MSTTTKAVLEFALEQQLEVKRIMFSRTLFYYVSLLLGALFIVASNLMWMSDPIQSAIVLLCGVFIIFRSVAGLSHIRNLVADTNNFVMLAKKDHVASSKPLENLP